MEFMSEKIEEARRGFGDFSFCFNDCDGRILCAFFLFILVEQSEALYTKLEEIREELARSRE